MGCQPQDRLDGHEFGFQVAPTGFHRDTGFSRRGHRVESAKIIEITGEGRKLDASGPPLSAPPVRMPGSVGTPEVLTHDREVATWALGIKGRVRVELTNGESNG